MISKNNLSVNLTNCFIKNLNEIQSLPQIKNLNENNKPLRIVVTITLEARNGVNDEGKKISGE
ncbi:hypothetical protein [Thermodesulfobium narugense]|uniref:hypothetical protein n=1 Tax=Thermodesulfobium narugense TaxID=184064 RepID=UPI0012B6119C|nr:hypothetical protein [Thermodesulfobium narugense]